MDTSTKEKMDRAYKYPTVAAELLVLNIKRIAAFFEQRNEKGEMTNFLSLFRDFLTPQGGIKGEMINLTRASYVQKVVVHFIRQNPSVFIEEIFNNQSIYKALFKHSYSRSVAQILQTMVT